MTRASNFVMMMAREVYELAEPVMVVENFVVLELKKIQVLEFVMVIIDQGEMENCHYYHLMFAFCK